MSLVDASLINVETCRLCSYQYEFQLPNGKAVIVLCGRPQKPVYKAVSYLWENTKALTLACRKCSATKTIPMRDADKLWNILNFVRGGSKIWLDALSIDQDDPKDLAAQLAVMGNIYRDAKVVSVMLPVEDKEAYEQLKQLAITADEIVKRKEEFGIVAPWTRKWDPGSRVPPSVSELASKYYELFRQWESDTSKWNYWSRAWTFQEWTMAAEIDIAWEGIPNHGGLQNIKNVIVSAASILGQWRMQNFKIPCPGSGSVLMAQIAVRAEVSKSLNLFRMHFPFQNFLIADEVEDGAELRRRTTLSPMHSISSGTSVEIFKDDPRKEPNLRRLLGLALTAMSISKRQARYEADLVHCWASMCNIKYEYDKDDTVAMALQKVVTALRKAGIQIFNFHANCWGGETDLAFMEYAVAMKHGQWASGAYMFGAPVFVGRVDTLTHIRHCLEQMEQPAVLLLSCDVTLQRVEKAIVNSSVIFEDTTGLLSAFSCLVSGAADGQEVMDVMEGLEKLLNETTVASPAQLGKHSLIPVSISCQDSGVNLDFEAWGVCPSHSDATKLFVARESLNGTLVLATPLDGDKAQILAYLNMTHQRHGTYLIKIDENGIADIVFQKPDPFLLEALTSTDFSAGPKPVDPDLMAMLRVPGLGLMDALDEASDVQLQLGNMRWRVA